jgi:penicillin-binding protein 2
VYKFRIKVFLGFVGAVLLVLSAKLLHLQVIQGREFRERAEEAMRKTLVLPIRRGKITDRKGRVLAVDRPCFDLCLDYRFLTSDRAWVRRQKRLLARRQRISDEQAAQLYEQRAALTRATARRYAAAAGADLDARVRRIVERVAAVRRIVNLNRFDKGPVREEEEAHPVVSLTDEAEALKLKGQIDRMVGAELRPSHRRRYPYGQEACHVIGYIGPVSADEEQACNLKPGQAGWLQRMLSNYLPADSIGKAGVEKMCERPLRGQRGYRRYRLTGETLREVPSVQGIDVHLTLDIVLQQAVADIYRRSNFTGSAVVLSVGTRSAPQCEVLAMVSVPTYDLNGFRRNYPELLADKVFLPLRHRAVQQRYQPGSTVKPLVALAGLGAGVVTTGETITCRLDSAARHFRCWAWRMGFDHGPQDTVDGLTHSCNPYFYEVGRRLGPRRMCEWFGMFGFAGRPGMGLPEEVAGTVPTPRWLRARPRAWLQKHDRLRALYKPGDPKNMAIGQGLLTATTVHVANAMATIARDGVFLTPMLSLEGGAKQIRRDLPLNPAHLAAVREGMRRVVNRRGGTAYRALHEPDVPQPAGGVEICGKTGTATTAPQRVDADGNGIDLNDPIVREGDTAWFVGFAPYRRPRIAFAVTVEYVRGGGGRIAGPIAMRIVRLCQQLGYVQ